MITFLAFCNRKSYLHLVLKQLDEALAIVNTVLPIETIIFTSME